MNVLRFPRAEDAARRMVQRELPAGWSADQAPTWDAGLRQFIVCATGPGFRIRGGQGRTRVSAWEDLAHRLRERRVHVQRPTHLALFMLLAAVPLLVLSLAPVAAANPQPTAPSAAAPSSSATPAWDPAAAATYPVPTLEVYSTAGPTLAPYRDRYYFRFETCPSSSSDRRANNSPAAQAYLRSRLSAFEFRCAHRIVLQESGWRPTALNWSGACGFPQSSPCSKMANFIAARHPDTCKPTRLPGLTVTWACDWRLYPNDQLDWMVGYVRAKYGSFWRAAQVKFGYRDDYGVWQKGSGIY